MHITRYFTFICYSLLLTVLSACSGGGEGTPDEPVPDPNAGWINIKYVSSYPNQVYLSGHAFISPSWWGCCTGSAADAGVTVTWKNLTTNIDGPAYQRVFYECFPLIGCWMYKHEWSANIPIVAGDNHIQMYASDPGGNFGYAEVIVQPGPPPPDTIAPTISSTSPQDTATDVGVNTVITAIFSEAMDPATIIASNFILLDPSMIPVAGTVTYTDTTATFTPSMDLDYSSQYTARITQDVQDVAGNPLASDYTWSFTTGIAPDTTPPTVTSVTPRDNDLCADPTTLISARFSEPIDGTTATTSSFIVNNATGDPIPGTVWASGSTMYFDSSLGLAYDSLYSAMVTTDVIDLAGNALGNNVSWSFTTQSSPSGSWQAVSKVDAPQSRSSHTAIWTGTEMIIWGGFGISGTLNTGGRYNPTTDSWQSTSTTVAPSPRYFHTAVWTGSEMIVWGGLDTDSNYLNTGARYNPATDSWQSMSTTGAPDARRRHTAVWTGSEMIVWGGENGSGVLNTGGRYDPVSDTWSPMSMNAVPSARAMQTAVWTGSEMIIWGGSGTSTYIGGRYNPSNDTWQAMSSTGAPSSLLLHTAVWTGTEMIVWGGRYSTYLSSGGIYNPVSNSWQTTSEICAPTGRTLHTAVWDGKQMIIWGGKNSSADLNSGGAYDLSSDTWRATQFLAAPPAIYTPSGIWTGSQMIIWGSNILSSNPGIGGLFTP